MAICEKCNGYSNGYTPGSQLGNGSLASNHIRWSEVRNPIEEQIRDSKELKDLYTHLPFIPYAGTNGNSSDSLISLLYTLAVVSPSQHACLNSIKEYAFGGKINIVESIDDSFSLSEEMNQVPIEKQKEFIAFLSKIKKKENEWLELASNCYEGFGNTGDVYIKVVMSEVAGEKESGIYVIDNRTIKYVNDGNANMMAISQYWDYTYVLKNPPEYIPVYPFVSTSNGITKFIIHKKNGSGFYGRPTSIGSLTEQYTEYKETVYRCTNATNRFNPDVLMEVSGRDPSIRKKENEDAVKSGFENLEDQLNFKVSAGNQYAPSIILTERPFQADPIHIHEFNVNTKEKYFKASCDISKERIFLSHNWSQKLAGVPLASGWSNEAFLDELRIKEITIKNIQNIIEHPINTAIWEIAKFMNPEMMKYSINFVHPFANVLKQAQDVTNSVGSGQ